MEVLVLGSGESDVEYLFLELPVLLEDVVEVTGCVDVFPELVPGGFDGDHEVGVEVGEEVGHRAAHQVQIVEDAAQLFALRLQHFQRLRPRLHLPQALQRLLHLLHLPQEVEQFLVVHHHRRRKDRPQGLYALQGILEVETVPPLRPCCF